jgi:4'-phosphopantetheinyl transferase superfamily
MGVQVCELRCASANRRFSLLACTVAMTHLILLAETSPGSERDVRFIEQWTLKESLVKATGLGFAGHKAKEFAVCASLPPTHHVDEVYNLCLESSLVCPTGRKCYLLRALSCFDCSCTDVWRAAVATEATTDAEGDHLGRSSGLEVSGPVRKLRVESSVPHDTDKTFSMLQCMPRCGTPSRSCLT